MLHHIGEFKNKYVGKKAVILGAGPSADMVTDDILGKYDVVIAINRAVVLSNYVDFTFIDTAVTLSSLRGLMGNTEYICMPIYSVNKFNPDSGAAKKLQEKVYFYTWVYDCDEFLNAPDYPLNDICLYIYWGNLHSVLHFCTKLGIKRVHTFGCNGGMVDGRLYSQRIVNSFGGMSLRPKVSLKRDKDHRKTLDKLPIIIDRLGLEYTSS